MEMINRKRGLLITIFAMILVFLTTVALYILSPVFDKDYSAQMYDLSNSWHIGEDVSGPPVRFYTMKQDEVFTMTTNTHFLPQSENAATLLLVTDSCMVQVYCYDTLLYTACKKEYEEGLLVPNMTHLISVPIDYQGQPLTVVLTAARNGAKIDTTGFCFGDIESIARSFTQRKGFAILFACFLIGFGSIMILLQLLIKRSLSESTSYIFQGLLLLNLGFFVSQYNHLSQFMLRDDIFNTYFLYIHLILIPYLLYSVMVANQNLTKSKVNNTLLALDITVAVIVSILNSTGVIHINELTGIICLFVGLHMLITLIHLIIVNSRSKRTKKMFSYVDLGNQSVYFGLCVLIISCILELAVWRFGISRRVIPASDVRGCFMMVGVLIMAACIIISYFYHCVAIQKDEAISSALKGLAYVDKLTELSNRTYCARVMESLNKGKRPCIIISLDLDGLKRINDVEGHQKGDLYITGFARLMREVFADELLVGRMGGDEFIIVLAGEDSIYCQSLMSALDDACRANKDGFAYKYSYGTAKSSELPEYNTHSQYMLADQRMYVMKEQHHKITARGKEAAHE